MPTSSSSESSSSDEEDKKRKKKSKKKDKKRKKDKKAHKHKKSKKGRDEYSGATDATAEELDEARRLWGDSRLLKKPRVGIDSSKVAGGVDTLPGEPNTLMESHEIDQLVPKETGRAQKKQSSAAKRHVNMAYARNDEKGGVDVVSDAALYGDDDDPFARKRAHAAASNARVMVRRK